MNSSDPRLETVVETVEKFGPPGTPFTTAEIAEQFGRADGDVDEKLHALVEDGALDTKTVGDSGRVWWRPVDGTGWDRGLSQSDNGTQSSGDGVLAGPTDAQRELRETKDRLQMALDAADMSRWEANVATGMIRADANMHRMYDLEPTDEPIPVERFLEKLSEEEAKRIRDDLGRDVEPGEEFQGEVRLDHVDDPPAWVMWHGRVDVDDPSIHRGVTYEITERKIAQQKLQKQAKLDAFRVTLTDAIRPLTDPVEIQHEAAQVLGEELDVDRAHYADVSPEEATIVVESDYYRSGVSSVVGEHDFDDYGEYVFETLRTGDSLVFEDYREIEGLSDAERAAYRETEIQANISVPLLKDGRLTALFVAQQSAPREWTETEIAMVEETVERTWAAVQRAQTEQALRVSERRYRTLFEEIDDGFALCELVRDDDEEVFDVRILELNPTLERLSGITREEAEGSLAGETFDLAEEYIEAYQRVAETGEFERLERYTESIDRWYDVRIFPRDDDRLAVLFGDITERKRREQTLSFLAEIKDDLTRLTDETAIFRTVGEKIESFSDAAVVYVADVDDDGDDVRVTDVRQTTDVPGVANLATYLGDEFESEFRAGESAVVTDSKTDPRIDSGGYPTDDVRSSVTVPFSRDGSVKFFFGVADTKPREWREDEVELFEEVSSRLFLSLERARTAGTLEQANRSLERLNEASRRLIDADTEGIRDRVAGLTRDVLDVEFVSLWQYDDAAGKLAEYDRDAAAGIDADAIRVSEAVSETVWQTFVGHELDVDNDLERSESSLGASPLRSRAFVPLGRHGVICAGSTSANAFDDQLIDLVETVAATVETAWDRAEGEQQLARQNEELTRLDRLNTLIREIDQALVRAQTVAEIDEAVCEKLSESALYEFAWISEYDVDSDGVAPRAWAGIDAGYLDELAAACGSTTYESPFVAAMQSAELQVVADVATDPRAAPWREITLERGARSCLTIPLVYDGATYGALSVYSDTPQHDDRDLEVLAELGQTIAHAINAVETRETLRADTVVELTLRSTSARTPLSRLARDTGSVIEFEGLVPGPGDDATVFFTASGASPEELLAAAEQSLSFAEILHVSDRDDASLFKARLVDPTLASLILDRDAVIRSLSLDGETATAVVDLPETAKVREFVEDVGEDVPGLELLSRRTRSRSLESEQTLRTAFQSRLTARQQEVLQLAYRSGYFESPRVQTGTELADALDISQSTFSHHLREAETKLLDAVFDDA